MTDKQKKEEIKQVVTNLGNIEFTVEDELKFCKEVLKRKDQECEQLKKEKEKYKQLANSFEADFYNALSDKESNYVKKLKQTLHEIKELCKTPDIYRGRMALGGKIREIISEVIKDEQV